MTCRTAGFATVKQDDLSFLSKVFSCLLMLCGGNPLGTAGGIKTTTVYIIILAMGCYLSGKKVTSFYRRYSPRVIVKAMSLFLLALATIFTSFVIIYAIESRLDLQTLNINSSLSTSLIYEIFSAFGTVGVTVGVTPYLSSASKIILATLMFIGRIGPITFFHLLSNKIQFEDSSKVQYVEEDFLIG